MIDFDLFLNWCDGWKGLVYVVFIWVVMVVFVNNNIEETQTTTHDVDDVCKRQSWRKPKHPLMPSLIADRALTIHWNLHSARFLEIEHFPALPCFSKLIFKLDLFQLSRSSALKFLMARKFNVDRALVLYQQHEIMRFGVIVIIEYFSQPYGLLLCSSYSVEYQQDEVYLQWP